MINNYVLGNSRTSVGTYHKQSLIALKKLALRDVQNDNRNSISNQPESSRLIERESRADTVKVCGVKRLVPDCPSSPPNCWSLSIGYANEDPMYAGRKSDLELSKRRIQEISDRSTDFCQSRPQFPKQTGTPQRQNQKPEHTTSALNRMVSQSSHHISEVSHSAEPQWSSDQQRMGRFLHLQKFLKHCDETDPKDYTQMLVYLSPSELSRHAIELEYRSIQLSIEEGKEIQRTMALNILGKPTKTNNSFLHSQGVQPQK